MGHLIYNNLIADATISKTELSGSTTETGNKDNLKSRSPIKNYILEGSGIGATYRIEIDFSSSVTCPAICILGCRGVNPSIDLWTAGHGSTAVSYTATTITKTRYIDGETYTDYLHIFDDVETFASATFDVTIDAGTDYIGSVYIADDIIDINFDHKKTRISPTTTAFKDRSNGGQVYSSSGITYDTINTATTPQVKATTIASVREFNNQAGTSEESIIVIEQADEMFFYGTQKKPATSTPVDKNDGAMLWRNNFSFEEEL